MTPIEIEGRTAFVRQRRRSLIVDVVSTLLTIVAAVGIATVVVALMHRDAMGALHALLTGPLQRSTRVGNWLVLSTTLTLLGLAAVVPFRAGQISIGAEGQLYLGALCGALVATKVHLPSPLAPVIVSVVAALAGGLAGAVPGLMKSRLGANEIVSTIMLNAVIVQLFDWTLRTKLKSPRQVAPVSDNVLPAARWPKLTTLFNTSLGRANIGVFVAVAMAAAVWALLQRTSLGYRMRLVGSNPQFAEYGGVDVPRVIDWSFVLGGALAGLAGAHLLLGVYGRLEPGMASGLAFLGIVVALLARNNPLIVVAAALFYGYLQVGGDAMEQQTSVGAELVICIQAVIVLLITARALPTILARVRKGRGA